MSALCIAAGGVTVKLLVSAFTLGWIHSIEKTPIEDRWIVTDDGLRLTESRIKGSGAGIEPGEGARVADGWIVWSPGGGARRDVTLRRSEAPGTGDWTLCADGHCQGLGSLLPAHADPVVLRPCRFDEPAAVLRPWSRTPPSGSPSVPDARRPGTPAG